VGQGLLELAHLAGLVEQRALRHLRELPVQKAAQAGAARFVQRNGRLEFQRAARLLAEIIAVMALQSPAAYAHEQLVGLQAVFHAEGLRRADDGRQTRSRGEAAVRRLYLLLAAQRYLQQIEIVQGLGLDAHLRPIAQASVGHVLALAQEQARI